MLSVPVEISDDSSMSSCFVQEATKKRPLCEDGLTNSPEDLMASKIARSETSDHDKEVRLSIVEEFINSFNLADNYRIRALLDDHCSETMTVQVPRVNMTLTSPNALFAYWFMVHETFPDGVMKILEKRHVSTTQPRHKQMKKDVALQVECVYKFSGTKIITEEVTSTLKDFIVAFDDYARYSYDELAEKVLDFISARSPPVESELQRNSVVELVLTFECSTAAEQSASSTSDGTVDVYEKKVKVTDWAFALLASTDDINTFAA